jgi:hypothetical protein
MNEAQKRLTERTQEFYDPVELFGTVVASFIVFYQAHDGLSARRH